MKVYLQVIDTKTGIYQCGMIDEPVKKDFEVENAVRHFGITGSSISWVIDHKNGCVVKHGIVEGTSKIINLVAI